MTTSTGNVVWRQSHYAYRPSATAWQRVIVSASDLNAAADALARVGVAADVGFAVFDLYSAHSAAADEGGLAQFEADVESVGNSAAGFAGAATLAPYGTACGPGVLVCGAGLAVVGAAGGDVVFDTAIDIASGEQDWGRTWSGVERIGSWFDPTG